MINNITPLLNKLADYSAMNEAQRKDFIETTYKGLAANLISDGSGLVPQNVTDAVKNSPSEENLKIFFEEVKKSEEGSLKIAGRVQELLESILDPVIGRLNSSQKSEILTILESK